MRPICAISKVFKNIYFWNFETIKIVGKRLESCSEKEYFYVRKNNSKGCFPEIPSRNKRM